MIGSKKILAIVPARERSKRIFKKNTKLLLGKPLIVYTIEAALKSEYLDKIIVSTDDKEITEVSRRYGVEVIKRPKTLATNKAKTVDAIFHVLDVLERKKYIPDLIVLLQPTSPLRNSGDIDKAINTFFRNKGDSVVSVYQMEPSSYWSFKIEGGYLKPLLGRKNFLKRSQDLSKTYVINGSIYIASPKIIRKYNNI